MRTVQKGKRVKDSNKDSTKELDKFIHRIQVKSRVTVDGKSIQINPVRESVEFNLNPSKECYEDLMGVESPQHKHQVTE